jgi:hypothetical protein
MVTTRRAGTDNTPLLVALMAEFYAESEFSLDRECEQQLLGIG